MEATASYLLMLQKDINSKQKILKWKIWTVLDNFSRDFKINNMKKQHD